MAVVNTDVVLYIYLNYDNSLFRNLAFFAGALLSVLVCLSLFDQDVLKADYVIAIMAGLGLFIKGCSTFIPDEVCFCLRCLDSFNLHCSPLYHYLFYVRASSVVLEL